MYKRIMMKSVDELYSFCLENNFVKFDSAETGNELVVEMPGNFQKSNNNDDKHREGLTPFVSRAFHDKVNLNKSKIETEVFKENLPSSHLRPILANIVTNEETNELDFGSHDFHMETVIEIDENGKEVKIEKAVYDEQPIGVIDGTRNKIEYDKEADVNRAVLHGYLYDEYCQDAIDILNRRGTVDCSIELSIRSMSFDAKDRVLILDDFYVSALTLLGSTVSPGMAGSNFKIEDFSVANNSVKFDKDEKLIELLETLNKTLSNFNNKGQFAVQDNTGKEETIEVDQTKEIFEEEVTETVEVTETEETTEEEVTVTENESEETVDETSEEEAVEETTEEVTVNESVEEVAETTEENFEAEVPVETQEQFEKMVRTYEISHEDTRYALYNLLSAFEESDNDWYWISNVYDSYFVYENWAGTKIYRQDYTKNEDNVTFENERIELFKELLTASEKAELEAMRSNYAALKEFKETIEKNELHAQKEEILNSEKYAVLAEKNEEGNYVNADFAELVKEMDNYSLTDLETKIKVMHSDFITANPTQVTFAANTEPKKKMTSVKLFANPNNEKKAKPSRYGNLFKESK